MYVVSFIVMQTELRGKSFCNPQKPGFFEKSRFYKQTSVQSIKTRESLSDIRGCVVFFDLLNLLLILFVFFVVTKILPNQQPDAHQHGGNEVEQHVLRHGRGQFGQVVGVFQGTHCCGDGEHQCDETEQRPGGD